jgi:glycosyltransferase involved in cell wall biosynthesis
MGATDTEFVWLTVGSFRDEAKDYDNLLRAFAKVSRRRPETRLLIAGEGALLKAKRDLASRLGMGSNITFLGLRRDIDALMSAADAFVLGSQREGMPIVLLEAAAMELPIVATDVGECASLVLPNVSGFIVPTKSNEQLASAMMSMMSRPPEERLAMGRAGREHIRATFDIDQVANDWVHRYSLWLSATAPSHRA